MDGPQDGSLRPSIDDCKRVLLAGDEAAPGGGSVREWLTRHPTMVVAAAAGLGLTLAFFPRARKIALPVAIAIAKRSIL